MYLFYSWKFIPFTPLPLFRFSPPPSFPSGDHHQIVPCIDESVSALLCIYFDVFIIFCIPSQGLLESDNMLKQFPQN